MQLKKLMLGIPVFLCAALLVTASPTGSYAGAGSGQETGAKQAGLAAKGKVLGISKKARTITIEDKKLGLVMIKFDDATQGLEFAEKDEAAIIGYKVVGADKIATVIKPKLATLPAGVTEVMPEDLAAIIAGQGDYLLIDSRPGKPYAAGHIPTAISIPVAMLSKGDATLLPQDNKDKLLIFYCGGPT